MRKIVSETEAIGKTVEGVMNVGDTIISVVFTDGTALIFSSERSDVHDKATIDALSPQRAARALFLGPQYTAFKDWDWLYDLGLVTQEEYKAGMEEKAKAEAKRQLDKDRFEYEKLRAKFESQLTVGIDEGQDDE